MCRSDFQLRKLHYDLSSRAKAALRRRSRGICGSSARASAFIAIALFGVLFVAPLHAAELANLSNGFSLRHDHHEVVGATTRLYMSADAAAGYVDVPTANIESFEPAPPGPEDTAVASQKAQDLKSIVSVASNQHQVDADFIASVIHAESAGNPRAVSPKGAQGLMQLMPGTASKLGVKDSFDAAENVDGGVRYLRALLLLYNGDMVKALAAYNAGPQRVQQYKGVPPYRETQAYVARVIKDYNRKKLADRKPQSPAQTRRAQSTKPSLAQTASASAGGNE
jgi:soluble lytic murein transglycosylase-like protein